MKRLMLVLLVIAPMLYGEGYIWPLLDTGGIQFTSSTYGFRKNPMGGGNSGFHMGMDLACKSGTPILAVGDGEIIVCAYADKIYGKYLILRLESGVDAIYGHLSQTWVSRGTKVTGGQKIGLSGNTGYSTGPHLHFGLSMDPMVFFSGPPVDWRYRK